MFVLLEPASSSICIVTHCAAISQHSQTVFGRQRPDTLTPGYQSSSSGWVPCRGAAGGRSLDCFNFPTPHTQCMITFLLPPEHHPPQRFGPVTRGQGGASVPRDSPVPAGPPSQLVSFDTPSGLGQSQSLPMLQTHTHTNGSPTITSLRLSCTLFPLQSFNQWFNCSVDFYISPRVLLQCYRWRNLC